MLEYIQIQEKPAFEAKPESERKKFKMLERKERENGAVLELLRRAEFDLFSFLVVLREMAEYDVVVKLRT